MVKVLRLSHSNYSVKVYLYPIKYFLICEIEGHILEVHCTNIQLKIFIK